jgi:tetratricopeptide (TPR) repeat protein
VIARAAALAACVAALPGCGGPARKLDAAMTLERERRPAEALAAYQELLGELGEGRLEGERAELRLTALRRAGDLAYLVVGDYPAAIAYYRRFVALAPPSDAARAARAAIGDIYRERFKDPVAAIAQYAALVQEGAADAPRFQLLVARLYLDTGNAEQARTEARVLRERWPATPAAQEALLVTAQAFAAERRIDDAVHAYEAAARERSGTAAAALALETAANLLAEDGRFDRAIDLYGAAIDGHPNPDAVRTSLEATRRRHAARGTIRPGDRAAALDHHLPRKRQR